MGLQVAEGALERCRAARRDIVRQRLRGAIEEARQSSMDPAEIDADPSGRVGQSEWSRGRRRPGSGQRDKRGVARVENQDK